MSEVKCPVCGDTFSDINERRVHLRRHSIKSKQKCLVDSLLEISGSEPATLSELCDEISVSNSFVYNSFNSFDEILKRAQYEKQGRGPRDRTELSENELLGEIYELNEEIGHPPSANEMDNLGKYNSGTYRKRFGKFTNAIKICNLEPQGSGGNLSGEEHPNYKGGRIPLGPEWESVRESVLDRDGNICRLCGAGENIVVHHILPRRKVFDMAEHDYSDEKWKYCNSEENLITLCRDCHKTFEGRWDGVDHDEFEELASEDISGYSK